MKKTLSVIFALSILISALSASFCAYAGNNVDNAEPLMYGKSAQYKFIWDEYYNSSETWLTFKPGKSSNYSVVFTKPNNKVYDVFTRVYNNIEDAKNNTEFVESDGLIHTDNTVSHIYYFEGGKTYYINAYLLADESVTDVDISATVTAHSHTFKEYYTAPDEYEFGEVGKRCTSCGYEKDIITFNKPASTKISKLSGRKKAIFVKWKKGSNISGYQIQLATNKAFTKNKKTVTVKGAKTVSKTVKKLKKKKRYYVRVRTYKTVSGHKVYSSWSAKKSIKTK